MNADPASKEAIARAHFHKAKLKDKIVSDTYRRWFNIGLETWVLGAEASVVMALRTSKVLLGGRSGSREARLMISEKMTSAAELQGELWLGSFGADPTRTAEKMLGYYRRKVRANRRRLS